MSEARIDHIEWAIFELDSIAERYKDFAAHHEQWERINNCKRAAQLAKKAIRDIRENYCLKIDKSKQSYDDHRDEESCYCAICKMPPCSWCTGPKRNEKGEMP